MSEQKKCDCCGIKVESVQKYAESNLCKSCIKAIKASELEDDGSDEYADEEFF